jgi:hypothetical protein
MSCSELLVLLDALDKKDCFSQSTSAQERGKKFSFNNPDRKSICRVKVDACLITNLEIRKCDFLFRVQENNKYFLIELKGMDVEHAVQQIINTYEIVNGRINTTPQNYKGVIVSSRVPAATEQKFRQLQDKCLREKRFKITKTHNSHTERI